MRILNSYTRSNNSSSTILEVVGNLILANNFGEYFLNVLLVSGVIIGKGGEMIKKIQTETGARLQFQQSNMPNEQVCRISGKGEQITEARRMILDLIDSVMVSLFSHSRHYYFRFSDIDYHTLR